MNAQELRIGNYIKFQVPKEKYKETYLEVVEITSYLNSSIQVTTPNCISFFCPKTKEHGYNFETSYFEFIPLTEEWLVKLGFEQHGQKNEYNPMLFCKNNYEFAIYPPNAFCKKGYWRTSILESLSATKDLKIPHVHQLQNLYFALSGEELTITNP